MNLKYAITLGIVTFVIAANGCSGGSESSSDSALPEVDVPIPTQAEADAEAARQITADNADQALAELEAELEREDGG